MRKNKYRKKDNIKDKIKDKTDEEKREYIEKNIILSINYPKGRISDKDKINSIIPQFKTFLNIYSTKIKAWIFGKKYRYDYGS